MREHGTTLFYRCQTIRATIFPNPPKPPWNLWSCAFTVCSNFRELRASLFLPLSLRGFTAVFRIHRLNRYHLDFRLLLRSYRNLHGNAWLIGIVFLNVRKRLRASGVPGHHDRDDAVSNRPGNRGRLPLVFGNVLRRFRSYLVVGQGVDVQRHRNDFFREIYGNLFHVTVVLRIRCRR